MERGIANVECALTKERESGIGNTGKTTENPEEGEKLGYAINYQVDE